MKNSIFIILLSMTFLSTPLLGAELELKGREADVPGMDELRGIERAGAPKVPSQIDPDDIYERTRTLGPPTEETEEAVEPEGEIIVGEEKIL